MNDPRRKLTGQYVATLRTYLTDGREAVLEQAYRLGRAAIAKGLGVLEMARVHEEALESLLWPLLALQGEGRSLKAAETFFLEALSPFEVTHRGFRDTNRRLQQLITTLEGRNLELAEINRRLQVEISERKRTERALQASEARLQAILDHSPAVIFLKDVQGRYLHVNRQFERYFRLGRNQAAGRTDDELFPRQQAALFRANDREVLRAGAPLEFEETARYHDGVHISIVSKFPLRDTKGKVYALCGIATDITARKRAEEALRQSEEHYRRLFKEAEMMQEELRNLSNQLLSAQEEERTRISRELHDEVGQMMTAVSFNLQVLKNNGAGSRQSFARNILDSQTLLRRAMETVHRFARELRPAMLDEMGLLPALRSHIKGFAERTGLEVLLRADPIAEKLNDNQKIVLFRLAQESLTNVAKHAHASQVRVTIRKLKEGLCLEIADNGKSFKEAAMSAARSRNRLGLLGMQERVRLVHGQFMVKPRFGAGTTIRAVIPFAGAGTTAVLPRGRRANPDRGTHIRQT